MKVKTCENKIAAKGRTETTGLAHATLRFLGFDFTPTPSWAIGVETER